MFFMITIMFVAFFGSQMVRAESYQRWITFPNSPGHIMTASEMADITGALGKGEISSGTYRLSTGVTYKIPQPNLFLEYIVMCVEEGEPSIITIDDVVREIQNGEVVRWGNDINVKVRNYYFSSLHGRVQFIDNYSGAGIDSVFVLLINGKPKIKMDCGNPLWVIGGDIIQTPPIKKTPPQEPNLTPTPPQKKISLTFKSTISVQNFYYPPAPKKKKEIKVGKVVLIGGGSGLLATAIVFVVKALINNNNHHHYVTPPLPVIEPRTMPDGIPAVPTPSTPGVPSDPRTMPPGTGG